jgi:hypothetical protein
MRIRLYSAFASNNSGSYTIVGSFREQATAEEVARLIQEVCDAHDAWHHAHGEASGGDSPLDELARRERLHTERPGRGQDWPHHGDKPSAVAAGHQVLVHAPYTATLTPAIGELFYARGGRVELEIDHAHDDLAVEFGYWVEGPRRHDREAEAKLDAFDARVAEELPAWIARPEHDVRPAIAPAWHAGEWGMRHLSVVFRDLVEGVRGVRGIAREAGVRIRIRIHECPHGLRDPFAALRAPAIPWGRFRVILWQIGADRIAAMKAVREVTRSGLAEAKAALGDLPREVLVDVDEPCARSAADVLAKAGCDVEVAAPATVERD